GAHCNYPAYEGVVQAKAGRMMDFGNTFALGRPAFAAVPVASFGAAQAALQGIAAALYVRARTRFGQRADTSLLHGLTAYDLPGWLAAQMAEKRPDVPVPGAFVSAAPMLPYMTARTIDGRWLQFANWAPHLFWAWLGALGLGHLKEDERFCFLPEIYVEEDRVAFWEIVLERVQGKTYAEWM